MSVFISQLTKSKEPLKVTIPSSGVETSMQAITFKDERICEEAFEPPTVPTRKDLSRGSIAAPDVPDENDPKYLKELYEYRTSVRIVKVARAMGLTPAKEQADSKVAFASDKMDEWAAAIVEEMTTAFTSDDLAHLGREFDRVQGGVVATGGTDIDPKAFSSLPAPVQAAVKGLAALLAETFPAVTA